MHSRLFASALVSVLALPSQGPTTQGPPRGALVLVGGGANRPSFIQKFVTLAGGSNAPIVVIPTALNSDRLTPDGLEQLRTSTTANLGVRDVVVLHTRDRREADTAAFVEPLRQASGVWVLGGNEDYLMDAYTGTRTELEIRALLARGGVFGGTSAGAILAGSVSVLGDSPAFKALIIDRQHVPFALLPNTVVLPHWGRRSLQAVLATTLASAPSLLGIGIDEATAAVIQQDRLEVVGDGHIGIYDGGTYDGKPYAELSSGQRYDLKARKQVPSG